MVDFQETYRTDFDVLGIIPVMFSKNTKTDTITLQDAESDWKGYVFKNIIKAMERVKYWDEFGITDEDHWDRQALDQYQNLAEEFLEKYQATKDDE